MKSRTPLYLLLVFLGLPLAVGQLGGWATQQSLGSWYPTLEKSVLTPPPLVFPFAWTLLYLLMGLAAWLVWRAGGRAPLLLWLLQLAVNLAWSFLFFYLENPDLGLVDVVLLLLLAAATALWFRRWSPVAFWLLVPYVLWVAFAAYLNLTIVLLN
ncbi:TspO and MBR related proteins [Tistlia consotensis]|uniref:TspO and MBR related proteins n=1 Tax=Tistlia consotensis USBA 355 TaxID=560819 RepID=A0A1Y6C5J1_9PROT|nr:TspO/MBR family protein [Tistlia consotensis]SMF46687.1 TspO and MBR related proteins [Tistlia consotensis USBA 355]SNR78132.1 TspO and MBR related proteins [Tistlia consotensis]